MSLSKETVAKVATLARLRLPEDQLEQMAKDLSGILDWINKLQAVDTKDVPPLTSVVEMKLPLREDKVTDGNYPEKVLANAPEAAHGFFAVPKVVE